MDAHGGVATAAGREAVGRAESTERSLSVSIVLPAHNEESNVLQAIEEATSTAERLFRDHEIIVVDDGSTDGTAVLVREASGGDPRVRLISHGRNRGYGEALRTGFLSSRQDYLFFTDADLQFDLGEIEKLLQYIGAVDVVVGYRKERRDPWRRRVAARGWNFLVRMLFYVPARDIDCAFKLMRRQVLQDLDIESGGAMVNTELMVKLGRSGFSVVEVGVTHRPRRAGTGSGASPRVIIRAFLELMRMRQKLSSFDITGR